MAGRALLDLETLPAYLFSRGLLAPADAVHRKVEVHDRTRRNRNFRVVVPGAAGLLVKQAGDEDEARGRRTLAAESAALRAFAEHPLLAPARRDVPRWRADDEADAVLVTELVHPATTLTKLHLAGGRPRFPPETAAAAGRLLARVHRAGAEAARAGAFPSLPRGPPGALTLSLPEEVEGAAMAQLADALRGRPFFNAPRAPLLEAWRAQPGLVHHDVRWDNLLVAPGADPEGGPVLRLIDWEMAGVGDPAWDVACYLGEHVRFWLLSAMTLRARDLADARGKAGIPFGWPEAGRAFWSAYGEPSLFPRVAALVPFHLLLQAFELTQQQPRIPGVALAALDLADRWHEDPARAMAEWFGVAP